MREMNIASDTSGLFNMLIVGFWIAKFIPFFEYFHKADKKTVVITTAQKQPDPERDFGKTKAKFPMNEKMPLKGIRI